VTRATVDLDTPAVQEVRDAWETLARHGDGVVWGRVSSSGKGVHLKVHGCDDDTAHRLRVACGDDLKRQSFDAGTILKPKQILFGVKRGKHATEWTPDYNELIKTYSDTAPRAYLRRYLEVSYPVLRGIL